MSKQVNKKAEVLPVKKGETMENKKGFETKRDLMRQTENVLMAKKGDGNAQLVKDDFNPPRVLLMQASSDFVKKGKAKPGDIVRAATGERIGGIDQKGHCAPIHLVPLNLSACWTIMKKKGNKFVRTEERNDLNNSLPWDFSENGEELKRYKTINLVCLMGCDLEKKLKAEKDEGGFPLDLDGTASFPVGISFRSSSFPAGQKIVDHFLKVESLRNSYKGIESYHYSLELTCFAASNAEGDWFAFDIGKAARINPSWTKEAEHWFSEVNKAKVIFDEADDSNSKDAVLF